MEWAWSKYGESIYTRLPQLGKELLEWCERAEINLTGNQKKALINIDQWNKQRQLLETAKGLMSVIGQEEFNNFNQFVVLVNSALKELNRKLTASELNAMLNSVSWYDAGAEKVVKGVVKLNQEKLKFLQEHLGCQESQLADYGYFPTGRKGEYLQYETESDLRDFENIPLKENIYGYFLREVKPHIPEAWINLDSVKTGYEISFNKYFYKHKPLRSIEEVGADILRLEAESEGLINEILNLV